MITIILAVQIGLASWYGPDFHGNTTASGEVFNQHAMTCAHRALPFGTMVRIVRLDTKASAVCRINDRGPFIAGRIVDVSRRVGASLGMLRSGTARVRLEAIK